MYTCDICSKTFASKQGLNRHLAKKHTEVERLDGRRTSREGQKMAGEYRNAHYYRNKVYEAEQEKLRLEEEEIRELRLVRQKLTDEKLLREVNYGE